MFSIFNLKKAKYLSLFLLITLFTLGIFFLTQSTQAKPSNEGVFNPKIDWFYLKTSNDTTVSMGKKSSKLPTIRYEKGDDHLQFSMTGISYSSSVPNSYNLKPTTYNLITPISSTTAVTLETNVKTPNEPVLFYRGIDKDIDVIYKISNIPLKVKEEIVLQSIKLKVESQNTNLPPTSFLFNAETTAKPVKQQDGSIAFFDNDNNYLFQLDKPFMIDAKGNRSEAVTLEIKPVRHRVSNTIKSLLNLQLYTFSPQSFLNNFIINKFFKSPYRHPMSVRAVTDPQQYTLILSADSNWLNSPNTIYPVIIDPTITHNEDAEFDGQKNRIADSDTTSSTQLESSYPEATKDPYTVLLLHFNEANGTQTGIRDYASTTRVITAVNNASTTSYVTQLGLGNSAAFDGTGDYFSMPDSDDFNFGSGDFSIDFWVNYAVAKGGADEDTFIFQQSDGNNGFQIYNANDESIYIFGIVGGSGVVNVHTTSAWNPSINTWHHLAFIRNGTNMLIFIDGVIQPLTVTISPGTNNFGNISAAFGIASRLDAGTQSFDGHLDSLRIIKGRALTPEEIKVAASRRPYAVYTSSVLDASASVQWDTLNWTEGGVKTGDGETLYNSSGLVAQWNFNETSGTTADNAEGTAALDGALTNFASTASQDQAAGTGWTANNKKWGGGALMMESAAAADYVSITDPASNVLDPNSADLTIETWIKTSDTSAEIFSNNNANGTACTSNGYYLGIDASGYAVFYLDTNGATAGCDASTTSQFKINDGNWHKIAVSVTRGTSAIIYVDGKSAGSDTSITSYSAITVTGNAFFGGSAGGLDAILDSTRYYSRALSASEILSNYNAGNIEIQTRTGATSDPNDGSWEAWKPTTGETQMFSLDNDAVNWHSDIMASTTIATSTETVIKAEGTGSLKIRTGMASTTAGTVALWRFEETGTTTGTYLYDETANNNDATTTGTTVVDGIFGKARKFNGTSDYVHLQNSSSLQISTISISGWVKRENTGTAGHIVGYGTNGWALYFGADNVLNFAKLGVSACVSTGTITDTAWHLISVTYDTSTCRFYVDGVSIGSPTYANPTFTFTTNLAIGAPREGSPNFKGIIDEMAVFNRVLSADEIAETYRMGANHHLTRQVSATDLSSANKLAFNVAADRPGTYLETMLGESDYANYELASSTLALSTTTVLYIKGDEIASSTSIKDSSFSGKAITANGNARTAGGGKIGNSVYFDGTGDYLSLADSDDWNFGSGDFSIDFWVKLAGFNSENGLLMQFSDTGNFARIWYYSDGILRYNVWSGGGSNANMLNATVALSLGTWTHVSLIKSGSETSWYINGIKSGSKTMTYDWGNYTGTLQIGRQENEVSAFYYLNGYLDELRIIKGTALTPDQIRQAYEYGLRSHQITIDFGATLQTSDLISNSTDYNFNITATTSGLSATTSGLYLGDKIIIKENLGGTEYTAQGTVNAINTTTGAITVPSWDTGSTFPASNGYSPNATVFKWQREYFDLTGAATTTRNAITNLTLRPTNGAEGRTVYLDDFRYNTNYLTASSSSAITSSNNRYLQYRAIFTSTDSFVSPFLSAFNTLYTSLADMFPAGVGISGDGFLIF